MDSVLLFHQIDYANKQNTTLTNMQTSLNGSLNLLIDLVYPNFQIE